MPIRRSRSRTPLPLARGHRPHPHRAHVLRGRPHRRRARDDPRRQRPKTAEKAAGQAAAVSAGGLHRHLQGAQGACRPRSGCSTRRCTSSCRTTTLPGHWRNKLGSTAEQAASACMSCTSSTRCSAIAAAAWASPSRRSPRCRRAPSSRPPPRCEKGHQGQARGHGPAGRLQEGTRPPGRDHPSRRRRGAGREEGEDQLHGRHNDRGAAWRHHRR